MVKSGMKKWKFRSRLVALQKHKLANGLETILYTYVARGKKYSYGVCKSSKQLSLSLQENKRGWEGTVSWKV